MSSVSLLALQVRARAIHDRHDLSPQQRSVLLNQLVNEHDAILTNNSRKIIRSALLVILVMVIFLMTGCASVGGVEVTADDTWFTVLVAVGGFITILWAKAGIEYWFNRRLEKYKHDLSKEE